MNFTVITLLLHRQQGTFIGLYVIFKHFLYLGSGSSMIVNVGRFCELFDVIHNDCRSFIDFLCLSYAGYGQDLDRWVPGFVMQHNLEVLCRTRSWFGFWVGVYSFDVGHKQDTGRILGEMTDAHSVRCRSWIWYGQDLGKVKLVIWLIYKTYVPVNLTGTYISLLMKFILLIYICASQSIFLSENLLVNNRKKVKNINWHIYSI